MKWAHSHEAVKITGKRGNAGGVAVVVEVEVVIRLARKAGEGVNGAGGQGV